METTTNAPPRASLPIVFEKDGFVLYQYRTGYILANENLEGFRHTHISTKRAGKDLIKSAITKKIPKNMSRYELISLMRLTDDKEYIKNIKNFMSARNAKRRYKNSFRIKSGIKKKGRLV